MRGLYLITNDDPIELLLQKLEAALATGQIAILQYRRKKVEAIAQLEEVSKIKALCEKYTTPFVINDNLKLAVEFGLGVHLGQGDGAIVDAVNQLGTNQIIGRTCANSLEFALQALKDGASYVAFGAIFPTATKPEAGHTGVEIITQARALFSAPICAIGGLTVENAAEVIAAGADLCAVISDILALSVEQIPSRVEAWAKLFATTASIEH
ncbi:thiamine phosphate synthase [Acinetobacter rudis]|uniref:Thiamine-phosphate synthase n=1 Tax=Acinetobacter rudis TaxID=632955 RepID=A0AAW8J436_9GAMM|nr:thiamine phosphate synthase [Acinetobacter rudis]MDQ8934418.1 thiamine phosphate synthase [Acinetobacter rudis]MDQ8951887.1 thiamine phosphate synthase [Acinetobacter rudis]MDQ9016682.1 thiamine phosphate synthase [Acinetobacter rudis]